MTVRRVPPAPWRPPASCAAPDPFRLRAGTPGDVLVAEHSGGSRPAEQRRAVVVTGQSRSVTGIGPVQHHTSARCGACPGGHGPFPRADNAAIVQHIASVSNWLRNIAEGPAWTGGRHPGERNGYGMGSIRFGPYSDRGVGRLSTGCDLLRTPRRPRVVRQRLPLVAACYRTPAGCGPPRADQARAPADRSRRLQTEPLTGLAGLTGLLRRQIFAPSSDGQCKHATIIEYRDDNFKWSAALGKCTTVSRDPD